MQNPSCEHTKAQSVWRVTQQPLSRVARNLRAYLPGDVSLKLHHPTTPWASFLSLTHCLPLSIYLYICMYGSHSVQPRLYTPVYIPSHRRHRQQRCHLPRRNFRSEFLDSEAFWFAVITRELPRWHLGGWSGSVSHLRCVPIGVVTLHIDAPDSQTPCRHRPIDKQYRNASLFPWKLPLRISSSKLCLNHDYFPIVCMNFIPSTVQQ